MVHEIDLIQLTGDELARTGRAIRENSRRVIALAQRLCDESLRLRTQRVRRRGPNLNPLPARERGSRDGPR